MKVWAHSFTLVCIVDEIACYECEAVIEESLEVMGYISQLMFELRLRITIKIFATSTIAVRGMRIFFRMI